MTLARRVPSICARNSCDERKFGLFNPVLTHQSHPASRSTTSCRRLHAASCVDCMARIMENC